MQVVLNGESRRVADHATIEQLLSELVGVRRRFAVEINGEIVPRSRHAEHRLRQGDKIEVVQAIGGG